MHDDNAVHVTGEQALTGIRRILDALTSETFHARDHVYEHRPTADPHHPEHPRYAWDGRPDCLLGQYLTLEFGITVAELEKLDANASSGISDHIKRGTFGPLLTFDRGAENVLEAAQRAQDEHRSWGEAEQAAQEALELHETRIAEARANSVPVTNWI